MITNKPKASSFLINSSLRSTITKRPGLIVSFKKKSSLMYSWAKDKRYLANAFCEFDNKTIYPPISTNLTGFPFTQSIVFA